MKMKRIINIILLSICIYVCLSGQSNLTPGDLMVLKEPANNMMKSYLTQLINKQFQYRDSILSTLKTANDWSMRAETIRNSMASWTGAFPNRTPLNARITGRIEHENYIIEKILFESRPAYLVSANLYLPKNFNFPRPALLNVIGHTPLGKSDERYQKISISLAQKGFVVLTFDGLGQGERIVNDYSSYGTPPGNAHEILGIQAFLSGTHIFNLMVWDAIRAVDYLISRSEVDPEQICITGSSGGGMMSTYILPFDNRIKISVPTCNPNTWNYRVQAGLGTDHEQVFFGAFASGIDPRGDPLFTHVPKPLLLNTTSKDILNPPQGVWELNTWLFKAYSAYGVPEKVSTTMVNAGHDYNKEQREITYSWLIRWTGGKTSDMLENPNISIEKDSVLWAANDGSVFNESGSVYGHDLILRYLMEHKAHWEVPETAKSLKNFKIKMALLVQKLLNTDLDSNKVKYVFEDKKSIVGLNIQSFVLEPEAGIILPGILLSSATKKSSKLNVVLYLNEKGKSGIIDDIEIVKKMLDMGYYLCAIDLRGIGETNPDMSEKFWSFLAGKPIFGQRVRDILATVQWLKTTFGAQDIKLWGNGMCALYGAFAGVMTNDISDFIFEKPLISFESIGQVKVPLYNCEVLLPGILDKFDMVQIYQALCPRPVLVINPLLGDKTLAGKIDMEEINGPVSTTYGRMNNLKSWSMQRVSDDEKENVILYGFETYN